MSNQGAGVAMTAATLMLETHTLAPAASAIHGKTVGLAQIIML